MSQHLYWHAPLWEVLCVGLLSLVILGWLIVRVRRRPDLAAVFMWTSGLTGAHRTYEAKSAQALLRDARAKTAESFEKSLQGNQIRLQRFAATHTEEEVVANDALQTQARSLLNIRVTLEAGLAAVRNGQSLIYSMEVSGDAAQIERLSRDNMVKAFERARELGGRVVVPHTPKPDAYQAEYRDPVVQAMSARERYQRIKALTTR